MIANKKEINRISLLSAMVPRAGLKPATLGLEDRLAQLFQPLSPRCAGMYV